MVDFPDTAKFLTPEERAFVIWKQSTYLQYPFNMSNSPIFIVTFCKNMISVCAVVNQINTVLTTSSLRNHYIPPVCLLATSSIVFCVLITICKVYHQWVHMVATLV